MKQTNIGGQAVLEGVMMRSEAKTAIAVRKEDGEIATQVSETKKLPGTKVPIVRGIINFVAMLVTGVKSITDAAKLYDPTIDEEPSKFEKKIAEKTGKNAMDVAIFFAVVIALVMAVGIFFILPNLITGWITPYIESPILKNLVDGLIRLVMFLAYMAIIANMKDIKRLFAYHGAEHKVINCYEHELPLTVENARSCSRLHPRCGTSFLLIVIVISILLFSLVGWSENPLMRIGIRLLMLPVVAGISYEFLKLLARKENKLTELLRKPGMALQKFSTREPDDDMIEVALVSFRNAEGVLSQDELDALAAEYDRRPKAEETESEPDAEQMTDEPVDAPKEEEASKMGLPIILDE